MTAVILTVFCLSGAAFLACFFLALCRDDHQRAARRSVERMYPDASALPNDSRKHHKLSSALHWRPSQQ